MLEKYLGRFDVSEEELKELIYEALKGLNMYAPNDWSSEFIEYAEPNRQTQDILFDLFENISILTPYKKLFNLGEPETCLRLAAIKLEGMLNLERAAYFLLKFYFTNFYKFILIARYQIALEFIKDREWNYIVDATTITSILNKWNINDVDVCDFHHAEFVAKLEVERICNEAPDGQKLQILLEEYEIKVEEYLKQNLGSIIGVGFFKLTAESLMKNIGVFNDVIDLGSVKPKDLMDFLNEGDKIEKQIIKTRLEYKEQRGGARESKGFVWRDEKKMEFYKTVESLPKVKGKNLWEYAFEKLNGEDFDYNYIEFLRNKSPFQDVPERLFREASKAWRKHRENFGRLKSNENPFAFSMYHALHLLNYPETAFSTMKRYYGEGKKLCKLNDLTSEKSK